MKQLLIVATSLLLASVTAYCQVPEIINHLYLVSDSNKLESLEKTTASMKTKMKLAGFGGSSSAYVIEGATSVLQIDNAQPSFAIKMGSTMMDPSQGIQLLRFDKKDKTRESIISKMGAMGTNASMRENGISYVVKQGAQGTFLLIPEKPLKPGEYGFLNMMAGGGTGMSYTVFAFTIR